MRISLESYSRAVTRSLFGTDDTSEIFLDRCSPPVTVLGRIYNLIPAYSSRLPRRRRIMPRSRPRSRCKISPWQSGSYSASRYVRLSRPPSRGSLVSVSSLLAARNTIIYLSLVMPPTFDRDNRINVAFRVHTDRSTPSNARPEDSSGMINDD